MTFGHFRCDKLGRSVGGLLFFAALLAGFALTPSSLRAAQFLLEAVDQDGAPFNGFRYLVQEDCMYRVDPQALDPTPDGEQAFNFHRSHCHALQTGSSTGASKVILNLPDDTDFFVSALPNLPVGGGFQTGGVRVPRGATSATVIIPNGDPFQTAQISFKVFFDGKGGALNNSPDVGEPGIAGFSIIVEDAGGQVQQDAFGNPLATTYQQNPDGTFVFDLDGRPVVDVLGTGEIKSTCSVPDCSAPGDGEGVIKFLAPGKYGIITVAPTFNASDPACADALIPIESKPQCKEWSQNTTIEGTKVVDAWVAPGNGNRLVEFGPAFWHIFHGWTPKDLDQRAELGVVGTSTITGTVRKGHPFPPPGIAQTAGPEFVVGQNGVCFVAVNVIGGVNGQAAKVAQCLPDGSFTIDGLAPGLYQLVVWDHFLHIIISFQTVEITTDGETVALGDVVVPMWFAEQRHNVFFDSNENGVRDAGEPGMLDQATLLRFRDGTVYQAFPTDATGAAPYEGIFPWFHWQVAEVDFARFKATGVTVINDLGGNVTNDADGEGERNPDKTTILSYGDPMAPTVGGPVLTQAFQNFQGQNLRFDWGKSLWGAGENGGLSGLVFYATTRAENHPQQYVGDPWEPGIPDVQVALFVARETNSGDQRIISINGIPGVQQPDQDNYPLGNFPGPEDINRCETAAVGCSHVVAGRGYTAGFDYGDAIDITWTDSWDANQPTGCTNSLDPALGVPADRCMDGLAVWNQIKDGVFDGGYAFGAGGYTNPSTNFPSDLAGFTSGYIFNNFTPAAVGHLPGGGYIAQVYPPKDLQGRNIYKVSRAQDKNVDFGPDFTPSLAALPEAVALCTGGNYVVPAELSLFPGVPAPLAGQTLRHCNQKFQRIAAPGEATLASNAVAEFHLHTDVPMAAKAVGQITDDLANEGATGKPNSTEKFSPPFLSVAFFDYSGNEIHRGYSSEFAKYNFLLPASVSQNLPIPSGMSPMMHRFCLNHPGPISDGLGGFITDPNFDPRYSTTCYTFDFVPGKATYLDTPVIRLAAFVGPQQAQTDCAQPNGTPVINRVISNEFNGPVLTGNSGTITIVAQGDTLVPDPASGNQIDTIVRDFGFGLSPPTIKVVTPGGGEFPLIVGPFSNTSISATVPAGTPTGQLVVTRGDNGRSSQTGVTLHVGVTAPVRIVTPLDGPTPIQTAVDLANPGDLILVEQGIYEENVIVSKELIIQGAGAPSTQIFAAPFSLGTGFPQLPGQSDKLVRWRAKLAELDGAGELGFLPGQDHALTAQEASGFLVIPNDGAFAAGTARIDGFQIQGANLGSAIFVNAYADGLTVSNNRAIGNLGQFGGGVRVGHPLIGVLGAAGNVAIFDPADLEGINPNVTIAHNEIIQNSSMLVGGGIALHTGSDNYSVTDNLICGNFSRQGGGGLAQLGRAGPLENQFGMPANGNPEDGVIRDNLIIFNEVFQGNEVGGGGGGIELAGESAAGLGTLMTQGTGSITIDRNLFHGNLGGAAPGGAISLKGINGADVAQSPATQRNWHRVLVLNNLISNNTSGQWGAGIALDDAVRTDVIHNTVARNDNASVASNVRNPGGNTSDPQPSGLVASAHSPELAAAMLAQTAVIGARTLYSHPVVMRNNIFNRNRSFALDKTVAPGASILVPDPAANQGTALGVTWDLGVVGVPGACLRPRFSMITETGLGTPDGCNYDGVALNNVISPSVGFQNPVWNDLLAATAADEGGNDTQVLFTPLTRVAVESPLSLYDYHITQFSSARGVAQDLSARYPALGLPLAVDVDVEARPTGAEGPDAGADERHAADVPPVNNPPVANPDSATTQEGVPVIIPVLANDTDPDAGDTLIVSQILSAPANGTATINPDDTVTYQPSVGFTGVDTFVYEISDSGGLTASALVTVTVNAAPPANNPPTANPDSATTQEGVPVIIPVLANDTDPDVGDTLFVSQITVAPANGTVDINLDGTVTYRPFGGFTGVNTFTYQIEDSGALTSSAQVTVTVEAPPTPTETITFDKAEYKVESGDWTVVGQTDVILPGGTMTIRLARNGALIATGVPVNNEGKWQYKESPPADPAAVPVIGDQVIVTSVPNGQTAAAEVNVKN